MDNKELIAALTERAGTYGALRKSALTPILLDRAAQSLGAHDARIAELEAEVERLRVKAGDWQLADGRY